MVVWCFFGTNRSFFHTSYQNQWISSLLVLFYIGLFYMFPLRLTNKFVTQAFYVLALTFSFSFFILSHLWAVIGRCVVVATSTISTIYPSPQPLYSFPLQRHSLTLFISIFVGDTPISTDHSFYLTHFFFLSSIPFHFIRRSFLFAFVRRFFWLPVLSNF